MTSWAPALQRGITNYNGIAALLDAVKHGERERAQLRSALERIQAVLADVLR